jgi:hypothetical protein
MITEVQKDRPPLITFETRAIEDRTGTIESGIAKYKDVDFVILTPLGGNGNLVVEREVSEWLRDHKDRGTPFVRDFEGAYKAWKEGEEQPETGTSLKNWPAMTPANVKQLLAGGCKTIEDLAAWPDGSLGRLGMGAVSLKQRAKEYLAAGKDVGKVAEKSAALEIRNQELTEQVNAQAAQLKLLTEQVGAMQSKKRAA